MTWRPRALAHRLLRRPLRRIGLAGAGAALERACGQRQGGRAPRPVVQKSTEKKLVFVHYRETLDHLASLLFRHGIAFARFEGSLSGSDKDAAIAAFRDEVPVLLCTE
jgi:SNF2 family DNA or RNA helicase